MDEKKPVDLANEPVDLDEDGMFDTGVLHEDEGDEDDITGEPLSEDAAGVAGLKFEDDSEADPEEDQG